MIRKVRDTIDAPIVAGGGIRSPEKARALVKAGASLIVVGNAIEQNNNLIAKIAEAVHQV
jgi:putative glycerol-1-phosphate prenyltransferase